MISFLSICIVPIGILLFIIIFFSLLSGKPSKSSKVNGTPLWPVLEYNALIAKIRDLCSKGKISDDAMTELFKILKPKATAGTAAGPATADTVKTAVQPEPDTQPAPQTPINIAKPSVKTLETAAAVQSGFLNAGNIRLLLISGGILFIFSAYLFVHSYWSFIPNAVKFGALAIITIAIYSAGMILRGKEKMTRTAEALLGVGLALIPFNFFSFDFLYTLNAGNKMWLAGFLCMTIAGVFTCSIMRTVIISLLTGSAYAGVIIYAGLVLALPVQSYYLFMSIGALALCLFVSSFIQDRQVRNGLMFILNAGCACIVPALVFNGFFLKDPGQFAAAGTLAALGMIALLLVNKINVFYMYAAGLCFMGAGALLLHSLAVPLYRYGLFFVPAGIFLSIKAWMLKQKGNIVLPEPLFILGQIAVTGSMYMAFHGYFLYSGSGFLTLTTMIALCVLGYGALAAMYKNVVFSYVSGITMLAFAGALAMKLQTSFVGGMLIFSIVSCIFVFAALAFRSREEALAGVPLSVMGFGTLSLATISLAGRFWAPFLSNGYLVTGLPADQMLAGILVGAMGVIAYGVFALLKRTPAFLYPMLISATMVYLFTLERLHIQPDSMKIALIAVASMASYYGIHFAGYRRTARVFLTWAEIVSGFIVLAALTGTTTAFIPVMVCAALFLPGIFMGVDDMTTAFLLGGYAAHFLWFRRYAGGSVDSRLPQYTLQLVFVNAAAALLRLLVEIARPLVSRAPFKFIILGFTFLGTVLSLSDFGIAWKVFLAYGILSFAVSMFRFKGKYNHVGYVLILAAYELFLRSHKIGLVEAYSVPLSIYLLLCGWLGSEDNESRTMWYLFAQAALYVPSFYVALSETWQLHGVFVGVAGIVMLLFGINQRNKVLVSVSLGTLLINGAVQSRQFLYSVPRWVYLGSSGIFLLGLGAIFEFKRESLIRIKAFLKNTFDTWD